jgi:hypothetical protein
MEDLIQNAHTLFDGHPTPSPPIPSFDAAETTTLYTYGSNFLSPELPQSAEVQAMGSRTAHRPGLVGGTPTSTRSSLSLPSDAAMESRRTPSPAPLLSSLRGLSSSHTLTEGVERSAQEELIPETRGLKSMETLVDSMPAEVASVPLSSVAEWRLRQSRLPPQTDAMTIPQSPSESVPSSMSDFPLSSATSLQTRMGPFSP